MSQTGGSFASWWLRDPSRSQSRVTLIPALDLLSKGHRVYSGLYRGYIGIIENKMETTIVYRGYSGIMVHKMETTIVCVDHLTGCC